MTRPIDIATLSKAYRSRDTTPSAVVEDCFAAIEATGLRPVWISLTPREDALRRARELESNAASANLPLFGIPFAVKDNIDAAGYPTTAGCPAYSHIPSESATVVNRLEQAGAILIGKTNLDQFATGLVGTRSPYGVCPSPFDDRYIAGGSSSGSAVAVATGFVSFAMGTDTAGSGRVPAALNNIVGLKPTRGIIGATGVVPACRTLDCVSVFAMTCADAQTVLTAASGYDPSDAFSRAAKPGNGAAPWLGGPFRFGIPAEQELEFFDDTEAPGLYSAAVRQMEALGGTPANIDFAPFREVAGLLYSGPWVAERLASLRAFVDSHDDAMHPIVRGIVTAARRFSAADAFASMYRLEELRRRTDAAWEKMDVLLLPTTGATYTIAEVEANPIQLNTNLGYYTNFVNLLDLAAVAVPAGFRSNGLPFGVSVIAPAFTDRALLCLADRLHRVMASTAGALGHPLASSPALSIPACPPGCVRLAVVGAHLTGQPLNWQLTQRGGRLMKACRTAAGYRLYALSRTMPPKPGLTYEPEFAGPGIEVEVWALPENTFGGFVDGVPPPLTIGNILLDNGDTVNGFLCEPAALRDALEITHLGGWRRHLGGL